MLLALASLPKLQQAFSDARTEIELQRWTIDAVQYGTHLSGLAKAVANAKVGMTAEFTLDVKNLELILGTSKGLLFKRRRDLNKRSPLDTLSTIGKKTKNSKGEAITRFEISITADGHIHVNNRDFGPLTP